MTEPDHTEPPRQFRRRMAGIESEVMISPPLSDAGRGSMRFAAAPSSSGEPRLDVSAIGLLVLVIAVLAAVLLLAGCSSTPRSPAAGSSTGPSPSAAPTPSPHLFTVQANALEQFGEAPNSRFPMVLSITDESLLLESARAATIADASLLPSWPTGVWIQATMLPDSDRSLVVVWIGTACDQAGTVTISAAAHKLAVAPGPLKDCEAIAIYRGLVLTLSSAIEVSQVKLELLPTKLVGE